MSVPIEKKTELQYKFRYECITEVICWLASFKHDEIREIIK